MISAWPKRGRPLSEIRVLGGRRYETCGDARIPGVFDDAVIQEAASRILKAAPPETRLILFGSHARGEADERSDLDFLVIEPSVEDPAQESVRLDGTLRGMLVPADVIVVSQESVREWRDVHGTVIHAALDEGRELAA